MTTIRQTVTADCRLRFDLTLPEPVSAGPVNVTLTFGEALSPEEERRRVTGVHGRHQGLRAAPGR